MADVTISSLPLGTPSGNHLLPYSTGSSTLGTPVSGIFQNTGSVILKKVGSNTELNLINDDPGNGPGNNLKVLQGFNSYITSSHALILTSGNGREIILSPAGNVGIDISNPQTKLHVNGTITATGINVPGTIIQSVFSSVAGRSLGTPTSNNTFPYTASALTQPQGSKFLSVTVTPKQASSNLFITVSIPTISETVNHSDNIGYAIWRDDITLVNSGWCAPSYNPYVPGSVNNVTFFYFVGSEQSGNTTARTYSFYSAWNGGAAVINGYGSSNIYNNAVTSYIRVDEIAT